MLARAIPAATACAVLAALSCTSLPDIQAGACGNGVVDSGEDCDTFAGGAASCRAPGNPEACRFDCSDDGHTCPKGYGCGTDSICRAGTRAFNAGPHVAAPGVQALARGDFDGDGKTDLAAETTSDIRVAYFDHPLALALTTSIPVGRSRAFSGQLDPPPSAGDNPLDDLVVAVAGGLDVFEGHSDRTITPVVYPSFPVPGAAHVMIPMAVNPKASGAQMVIIGSGGAGAANTIIQVDKRDLSATDLQILSLNTGAPTAIVPATPIVAHFVENQTLLPCQQLAFAYSNETRAHLFSPCHPDGTSNLVSLPTNPQPPQYLMPDVVPQGEPGTITGVLLAYLNQDTHADLLIGTTAGIFASYGVGDGTFNSSATLPATGSGDGVALLYPLTLTNDKNGIITGFPLAAGDLNADGFSDLVYPTAIVMASGAANAKFYIDIVVSETWNMATIADLNGNGSADLLAISGATIDFFSGNGTTVFDMTSYSTDSNIDHFAVGDFDGDTVNDVVISEPALDLDGNPIAGEEDLDILFGRPSGGYPESPVVIGQLPTVAEICVGALEPSLLSPTTLPSNASDIAVLSVDPADPMQQLVAAFVGRPDRELSSPLFLVDGKDPAKQSTTPLRFVTGHFTQLDHEDIAAIAAGQARAPIVDARFWIVPVTGSAQVATASIQATDVLPPLYDYNLARMAALDLTGAGFDSAVAVVPPTSGKPTDAGLLMVGTPGGVSKTVALGVGDPLLKAWGAKPGDADGDGKVDLGLLYADRQADGTTGFKLRVLWNTHSGDVDPMNGADVPLPAGASLNGFVLANIDADGQAEAVLATTKGVFYSKADPAARTFGMPVQLNGVTSGSAVQSGDFDGDGVTDLAVNVNDGADLYRGVPKID